MRRCPRRCASRVRSCPSVPTTPPDPEIERRSFKVADGFEVNLLAADPLLAKPIQMNWDAAGPAVGRVRRDLPADQARRSAERQGHRPRRHRRRRQGRQVHRLRRRPAHPHRRRARRRRGVRRQQHRAAPPQGHRRRRQGRPAARRPLRLRHRGHAPHHPHVPLGHRRPALLQPVDLHPQPRRDAARRAAAASAAASGGSARETLRARRLRARHGQPVGPRLRPLGPVVRHRRRRRRAASTTSSPAPRSPSRRRLRARAQGPEPRQPEVLRPGDRQRPAPARRLAGQRRSPTTSAPTASSASRSRDEDGSVHRPSRCRTCITSTDVAFRPIDVKMGPDGAIYIADWYNPIINHGEVDFRDPRRDKTHGRIWRITAKGRPLVKRAEARSARRSSDVLEQLKSPEGWTRQQAKLVLRSLGAKDVVPALGEWVDEARRERPRRRAPPARGAVGVPDARHAGAEAARRAAATRRRRRCGRRRRASCRTGRSSCRTRWTCSRRAWPTSTRACGWRPCAAWRGCTSPRAIELAMTALDKPLDAHARLRPVDDGERDRVDLDAGVQGGRADVQRQPAARGLRAAGGEVAGGGGGAGEAASRAARCRRPSAATCSS